MSEMNPFSTNMTGGIASKTQWLVSVSIWTTEEAWYSFKTEEDDRLVKAAAPEFLAVESDVIMDNDWLGTKGACS